MTPSDTKLSLAPVMLFPPSLQRPGWAALEPSMGQADEQQRSLPPAISGQNLNQIPFAEVVGGGRVSSPQNGHQLITTRDGINRDVACRHKD
jgi:hypothetical protein